MESRKMVLMNLFTAQQWRRGHREQTYGHGRRRGKERVGRVERNMEPYTLPCVRYRQSVGICCMTQGTQIGAL